MAVLDSHPDRGDCHLVRRAPTLVFVVALSLACAAPASAVTRHASPTGVTSVSNCTDPEPPCSLERAVETVAVSGDLVLVEPGDYNLSDVLLVNNKRLEIRASQASAPRVVSPSSPALQISGSGAAGSRVADMRFEAPSSSVVSTATVSTESVLERLTLVGGAGGTGVAVRLEANWVLRDSYVSSAGPDSVAVQGGTGSSRAVNVTALAPQSDSTAFEIFPTVGGICVPPFTGALLLTNVIARGGQYDVSAPRICSGAATISVAHSNFRRAHVHEGVPAMGEQPIWRVYDLGGNQEAEPLFAAPASLDFHQLAGSATIDAGVAIPFLGTADPDGHARTLGAAPDIGADEFPPPPPPPPPPPGAAATDTTAPVASLLTMTPSTIRTAAARAGQRRRGARISYALTEAASTRFTVQRVVRRDGRTRFVRVRGSFTDAGEVGGNTRRFRGRVGGRRLRAGRYRLIARPTDAAGNVGLPVRTKFRVLR